MVEGKLVVLGERDFVRRGIRKKKGLWFFAIDRNIFAPHVIMKDLGT